MARGLPRPTEVAQAWVGAVARRGERVVDATVGAGHDTLFLAACVGPAGRVTGFDVQACALERAREKLVAAKLAGRVDLLACGHEEMAGHVVPGVAAVMFNLGWLPGGDHALVTREESTLCGLRAAWGLLRPGGLITVVAYPGHPGGAAEWAAVEGWVAGVDTVRVRWMRIHHTRRPAPVLVALERPV